MKYDFLKTEEQIKKFESKEQELKNRLDEALFNKNASINQILDTRRKLMNVRQHLTALYNRNSSRRMQKNKETISAF